MRHCMRKSTSLQSNKQPLRSRTSTTYETTVDLVEKSRPIDVSDVKTKAIEEQVYSVPNDPEQSDMAYG